MSQEHVYPESDTATAEILEFIKEKGIDTSAPGWRMSLPKPPKVPFSSELTYHWVLRTNHGTLKVRLMPDQAPMHVSSTLYLTLLGFYDNLKFHRIIPNFMAQGGCPKGSGTGGPGYQYDGEFGSDKHDRPGLLSMANAGPGTDGSQFFLTFVPTSWLDGAHSIFGEVVEGLEVLPELEKRGSEPNGAPTEKVVLEQATLLVG